jgi:hypothetical protein
MKIRFLAALLAFAIAPLTFGADDDNPYKKSKVGDYTTFKLSTKVAGTNIEGIITQTVTEKTEKEVKLKVTGTVGGMEIPASEQKIDITKAYDPGKNANLPEGTEAKIEKVKDGAEKVKIGDTEYDCKWQSYKMKASVGGMELESEYKVWYPKDFSVPMVKMEMTAEVAGMKMETTMELQEKGNEKDNKKDNKK